MGVSGESSSYEARFHSTVCSTCTVVRSSQASHYYASLPPLPLLPLPLPLPLRPLPLLLLYLLPLLQHLRVGRRLVKLLRLQVRQATTIAKERIDNQRVVLHALLGRECVAVPLPRVVERALVE